MAAETAAIQRGGGCALRSKDSWRLPPQATAEFFRFSHFSLVPGLYFSVEWGILGVWIVSNRFIRELERYRGLKSCLDERAKL